MNDRKQRKQLACMTALVLFGFGLQAQGALSGLCGLALIISSLTGFFLYRGALRGLLRARHEPAPRLDRAREASGTPGVHPKNIGIYYRVDGAYTNANWFREFPEPFDGQSQDFERIFVSPRLKWEIDERTLLAGYEFEIGRCKLTAQLNVQNLFDQEYAEGSGGGGGVEP